MRCDALDPLIEAVIDGSFDPSAEDRAHLDSCERCRARLSYARSIEQWLAAREMAQPPASFTTTVMTRVVDTRWQAERFIDLGFNLAVAAGLLVILAGAAGFAWSMGLLTISVDVAALLDAMDARLTTRLMNQFQTIAISAVLLTMALVVWWWAETATD